MTRRRTAMRPDGQTAAEEEGNFGLAKRSSRPLEALLDLVERLVAACHGSRIPFLGFGQSRGASRWPRPATSTARRRSGSASSRRSRRPTVRRTSSCSQATSPPTASPSKEPFSPTSRGTSRHRSSPSSATTTGTRIATRSSRRRCATGDPAARADRGDMHRQRRRGRNRRNQGLRRVLGLAATRFR